MQTERERALLDALQDVTKALMVCKPHLDHPFPDRPTLTPWTLTCERPFKAAARMIEEARRGGWPDV